MQNGKTPQSLAGAEDTQSITSVQQSAQPDQIEVDLATLQARITQAEENEKRALADYKNLVRRTQADHQHMVQFANVNLILKMLEPLDHLAVAQEHLKDAGVKMIYQQFSQALETEGVKEIECIGKSFSAETMEVVQRQTVDDPKKVDMVLSVSQRGYLLHGEVIRPARVVVGVKENKEEHA